VHIAASKGDITEKDAAMTMLNNTSNYSVTPVAFRRSMRFFILRLARFINGFVANVIAQRERQAQLAVLRSLNDRELMDIGLNRCEIGEGLAEAAKARSLGQQSRKQLP
jgi:uncharacterized protein YjiS (DUF1127 family)